MRKRKNPRLLLDVDGVLADFVGGVIKIIKTIGGPELKPEDFPYWDIFSTLKERHDTSHLVDEVVINIKRMGFCYDLPVYPGAKEGVQKILDAGIDLFIVTSPWPGHLHWMPERSTWLKTHFNIPEKKVIHANAKYIIKGDLLIDDKTDHIEDWLNHNPDGAAFLWNTPHNQRDEVPRKQRLSSWDELHDILRIK